MAHVHDLGDGRHRQPVVVGATNRQVALNAQLLGGLVQLLLALDVLLSEGGKTGFGLWGLAFRTGDLRIVVPILASRLA